MIWVHGDLRACQRWARDQELTPEQWRRISGIVVLESLPVKPGDRFILLYHPNMRGTPERQIRKKIRQYMARHAIEEII